MKKILLSVSRTPYAENYLSALSLCGAEGELIYSETADPKNYSGLILCGGGDIAPEFFKEKNNGSVNIDKRRDKAELELIKSFHAMNKPIFGICRGMQVINVFFGGTITQDIPSSKYHKALPEGDNFHSVYSKPGSIVSRLYGKAFQVNSAHHEACKSAGANILYTASWHDEIPEALQHISAPVFAVQWHPERLINEKRKPGTAAGKTIFDYFVKLCEK